MINNANKKIIKILNYYLFWNSYFLFYISVKKLYYKISFFLQLEYLFQNNIKLMKNIFVLIKN
jgi:hypothetical protein